MVDVTKYVESTLYEKLLYGEQITPIDKACIFEYLDFDVKLNIYNKVQDERESFECKLWDVSSFGVFVHEEVMKFINNNSGLFKRDVKNSYFTFNGNGDFSFYSIVEVELLLDDYKDEIISEFIMNFKNYF